MTHSFPTRRASDLPVGSLLIRIGEHDMTRTEAGKARIGGLRGWFMREGRQLLVMLVLLAIARTSLANHYSVPSGSVEYTLMPGDHVMVDMSAYGLRVPFTDITVVPRDEPGRGDIEIGRAHV